MFEGKIVVIWGCGENTIRKKQYISDVIHPFCFFDSDKKYWGKEIICGCMCYDSNELDIINPDVVIISPENPNVVEEIQHKINKKYKLFTLNELWEKDEIELQQKIDFGKQDNRIKHFGCVLGDSICNIGCSYCYLKYERNGFRNMTFPHSIDFMIKSVSKSRMGGPCFFDMCSNGETLLKPGIIEFTVGLLREGHYVCLITNATPTKQIEELLCIPFEMKKRLLFHCSLHYIELKKRRMLDVFFENVKKMHNAGASVSMSIIGNDEYLPFREEIKRISEEKVGVIPYISACRTEDDYCAKQSFKVDSVYSWPDYLKCWEGFSGRSLEMRDKTLNRIDIPCYSGINSGMIDFEYGNLRSCVPGDVVDNIYNDIKRPIKFYKKPHNCKWGHCSHNVFFLSGRMIDGIKLPTWKEAFTISDEFISEDIREATNYCCDY